MDDIEEKRRISDKGIIILSATVAVAVLSLPLILEGLEAVWQTVAPAIDALAPSQQVAAFGAVTSPVVYSVMRIVRSTLGEVRARRYPYRSIAEASAGSVTQMRTRGSRSPKYLKKIVSKSTVRLWFIPRSASQSFRLRVVRFSAKTILQAIGDALQNFADAVQQRQAETEEITAAVVKRDTSLSAYRQKPAAAFTFTGIGPDGGYSGSSMVSVHGDAIMTLEAPHNFLVLVHKYSESNLPSPQSRGSNNERSENTTG